MKRSGDAVQDTVESRLDYVDGQQRLRAVSLLFCGALSGLCGFLFAGFLGVWKYKAEALGTNFRGEPFASGFNYYPQTVSEMVSDPQSPAGKCFFAFCMVGAICMLMSWYPWQLRNVYIGDDITFCGIAILTLRQFLPPIGMMLVACIQVVPAAQATFRDRVSGIVHVIGAIMMIGGNGLIEIRTLCSGRAHLRSEERTVRWCLTVFSLTCAVGFQVCGALLLNAERLDICCLDDWRVPTEADVEAAFAAKSLGTLVEDFVAFESGKKLLYNTAYGSALIIKQTEYWLEVFSGLSMIATLMAIWWYCPERHLSLSEHLPNPGTYWDGDEDVKADKKEDYGAAAF